jgi:hypothetical protein
MDVFVSSTFEDLVDHRRVLREALDADPGFRSVGMEDFSSSGMPSIETCFRAIAGTSASITLIGYRYGSLVPTLAVSYTEAEYERALGLGHQAFAYIRENFDRGVDESPESDEQKRKLRQFRATIESDVTVERSPFTTPEDLARRALADLTRWLATDGSPVFKKPLLDIQDVVAYASRWVFRQQASLLAPRVVLVDLGAVDLTNTPRPEAGGVATKLWKIKMELEEAGYQVFIFTDLPATDDAGRSRMDQRLAQVRASDPLLVCFARDEAELGTLERFREAGCNRILWYRDQAPPEDFPRLQSWQFDRRSLISCEVAARTEDAVARYVNQVVLEKAGASA